MSLYDSLRSAKVCPTRGHTNYISRPCQTGVNLWEGFWSPANNNGRTVLVGHAIGKDPCFLQYRKAVKLALQCCFLFFLNFNLTPFPRTHLGKVAEQYKRAIADNNIVVGISLEASQRASIFFTLVGATKMFHSHSRAKQPAMS